jgi:hypothetical protein
VLHIVLFPELDNIFFRVRKIKARRGRHGIEYGIAHSKDFPLIDGIRGRAAPSPGAERFREAQIIAYFRQIYQVFAQI